MVRMLPHKRGWAERYLKRTRDEIQPVYDASRNEVARKYYVDAVNALQEALDGSRVSP
jgi:hypothetical protein